MARRLPRAFLVTVFFLVAVQSGNSQQPIPLPPPTVSEPKPAEPAVAGKELFAKEIALIEKLMEGKTAIHKSSSRTFILPVNATEENRSGVREFRLYVKAPQSVWKLYETSGPEVKQFTCRMDRDGEYGFALAIVDKNGELTMADGIRVTVEVDEVRLPPPPVTVIPSLPPPPPFPGVTEVKSPKPPELSAEEVRAQIKKFEAKELDGLLETAFGKDSAEMNRPVRVWTCLPGHGIAIAASEAKVSRDGKSVRFRNASIGLEDGKVFRGDEVVVIASQRVEDYKELMYRPVTMIEVHGKTSITTLSATPLPVPVVPQSVTFPAAPQRAEPLVGRVQGFPATLEIRFKFKIDSNAPLTDLLPTPRKTTAKLPHWTNEDLSKVPELAFGEPISKSLPKHQGLESMARTLAKVNHLNAKKRDGFLLAMLENRPDLRGLPFQMGDDCRMGLEQMRAFTPIAGRARLLTSNAARRELEGVNVADYLMIVLNQPRLEQGRGNGGRGMPAVRDVEHKATVAALTQILMPEPAEVRVGLAKHLATIPHIDATKALARLAIFSPEDEVRAAAIDGLKLRRDKDYTDVLVQGLRYPLPAVAKRSADAMVKLERKDLLANLIEVLESPDPRLPVTRKQAGKEVSYVREVVKVNHHQNCLLCHAPGNTENVPEEVLKVAVPLPGEAMPEPAATEYYTKPTPTPDIVVRLDMTYLRQDFSVMLPVSEAHPWPEMQRFDYLALK